MNFIITRTENIICEPWKSLDYSFIGNSIVKNNNNNNNKMDENQRERAGSSGRVNGTKVKLEASISNESVSFAKIIPNVSL